ncbi:uncharacterized protein PAC_06649 [Phialocephala subalpina]|uniref:Gfd2/YDR514C-like C-terminal domain-containing protein n=1 Tax=Phialocephala subalpina TaxID=576137 RepID=A0A1L7WVG1_9HELO|nr:uncharacterized protein PAC_06649 [Phialocephala subalpina]
MSQNPQNISDLIQRIRSSRPSTSAMDFRPRLCVRVCAQTLEELLCFPSILEPIFVAIDFEAPDRVINNFSDNFRGENAQVGISILDTRELHSPSAVQTFNFIAGSAEYYKASSQKFIWGTSEYIWPTKEAMLERLNKTISRDRNIVLVGHGFGMDLQALHSLDFDLETSILGLFDTFDIARKLQMPRHSLGCLLEDLGCCNVNRNRLHNAGNDANYTLQALLLLALRMYPTLGDIAVTGRNDPGTMYPGQKDNDLKTLLKAMNRMSIVRINKQRGRHTRFTMDSSVWLENALSRVSVSNFNRRFAMVDFDECLKNLSIAC